MYFIKKKKEAKKCFEILCVISPVIWEGFILK